MYGNQTEAAEAPRAALKQPSGSRDGRVAGVNRMTDELHGKAGSILDRVRSARAVATEQLDRLAGPMPETDSDYSGFSGTSALHTLSEQLDYIMDEVARIEGQVERLYRM